MKGLNRTHVAAFGIGITLALFNAVVFAAKGGTAHGARMASIDRLRVGGLPLTVANRQVAATKPLGAAVDYRVPPVSSGPCLHSTAAYDTTRTS